MSKELLEQAIERLKELKEKSTPGPWHVDVEDYSIWTGGETVLGGTVCFVNTDQQTGSHKPKGDAELIVTLHRTIEAQIEILRFAEKRLSAVKVLTGKHLEAHEHELALAKAILGVE